MHRMPSSFPFCLSPSANQLPPCIPLSSNELHALHHYAQQAPPPPPLLPTAAQILCLKSPSPAWMLLFIKHLTCTWLVTREEILTYDKFIVYYTDIQVKHPEVTLPLSSFISFPLLFILLYLSCNNWKIPALPLAGVLLSWPARRGENAAFVWMNRVVLTCLLYNRFPVPLTADDRALSRARCLHIIMLSQLMHPRHPAKHLWHVNGPT